MKHLRCVLPLLALAIVPAFASAQSDAQKSFDSLKSLAGTWEGTITSFPATPEVQGKHVQVTLRVTSVGNALLHEMHVQGRPDDPITMLYLDNGHLMLTHYCDAGNRPRMTARTSVDGKTVEFEFVDVAGGTEYGHMHHAVFTLADSYHHSEDWTFMSPGEKPVQAHFDLHRTN